MQRMPCIRGAWLPRSACGQTRTGSRASGTVARRATPQRVEHGHTRSIVISAAAPVNSAAGGGAPVETGGRDDHVRRTRSLSRRALGGDRDPGRIHRLRPRRAHPRHAGRRPSPAAGGRRRAFSPSASGPCISSACWPRRCRPSTVYLVLPTIISFLICALVVGISLFFVSDRRAVAAARGLLGGAARAGIASMHYVGMHGLSGDFAIDA